jgi:putative SOS response-associated peptidase YedK
VGHNAARMCGRFALFTPPARIARYFGASLAEGADGEHAPSWNVAPTDPVLGVRDRPARLPEQSPQQQGPAEERGEPERILMSFRWGLIPWWSKDAKSGSRLFNARSETVATRASFREAFRERRIIVPADGFYEWRKTKTGAKQPHYFSRADGQPLAFAGLAERWRDKTAGSDAPLIRSCTVITSTAGADMSGIHDRMPVILDPATFDLWLDPANEDIEALRALLRPPPDGTVVHHPVGPRIGNVRNNDPALIESV